MNPSEALNPDAVRAATSAWLDEFNQYDPSQNLIVRGLLAAGVESHDATVLSYEIASNAVYAEMQAPYISGYCEGIRWLVAKALEGAIDG